MTYAEFYKGAVPSPIRSTLLLPSTLKMGEVYKRIKDHGREHGCTHYAIKQQLKGNPTTVYRELTSID